MQKIRSLSQISTEILRLKDFVTLRFWPDLTYENACHSLNFWDKDFKLWNETCFYERKKFCFEVKAQKSFFQYPSFLAPPSPANRVKAKTQIYFSKYLYLIFRKSQEVSNQYLYRFRSSIICKKRLGAKRPPH